MNRPILLASDGCDRATAYHMSNKIVRTPDGVCVTWLDRDYRILVGRINSGGGRDFAHVLAHGTDNHSGAVLAATPDGLLHMLAGSHHHGFIHRFSPTPEQAESWSPPLSIGYGATYPSLVALADGGLALAYRYSGSKWGVHFMRWSAKDSRWGHPLPLVEMPSTGYAYTTNCLARGPGESLHLLVEFYKTFPENRAPARTVAVSHFESPDGGVSWFHDDGRPFAQVPVCLEDSSPVIFRPKGNARPGNLVVLPDGRPAFGVWDSIDKTAEIFVRGEGGEWVRMDLTKEVSALKPGRIPSHIPAFAPRSDGRIAAVFPASANGSFGDPDATLAFVDIDLESGSFCGSPVFSDDRPGDPSWLPSIEKGRMFAQGDGPYVLYTRGNKGPSNMECEPCDVCLHRLASD
ncbi:MAG: BNR-4 repeat-containing protein [Verrucomicrobiota bacterium]